MATILDPPGSVARSDLRRLIAALDAAPFDYAAHPTAPGEEAPSGGCTRQGRRRVAGRDVEHPVVVEVHKQMGDRRRGFAGSGQAVALFIATILERFDVIATQELKHYTTAFKEIVTWLNRDTPGRWAFVITDSTSGTAKLPTGAKNPGNYERLGYLYDTNRVSFSVLAGELVIPWHRFEAGEDLASEQFARTPYAVSFATAHGGHQFILLTVHVNYSARELRAFEIREVARWVFDWSNKAWAWDTDIIVLGDFNADRFDQPNYRPFADRLHVPHDMGQFPRTIYKSGRDKHYDMVTWLKAGSGRPGGPGPDIQYLDTGYFDFTLVVLRNLNNDRLAARVSDHYPLWVRFSLA